MSATLPLYPAIEPYATGWLDVGDGHRLYFEQLGNPAGIPAVYLHGGPGSGCSAMQRRFFDPARYRVILLDQRGCGRSTPRGETSANTTAHLLADLEKLRRHLGIDRWLVVGGSWGASLAVAYAGSHPASALGVLARAMFFTGRADLDWFFGPAADFAPQAWQHWQAVLPICPGSASWARRTMPERLAAALAGPAAASVALAWLAYERLLAGDDLTAPLPRAEDLARLVDRYRVQSHYFRHQCFLGPRRLLQLAQRMADLPVTVIHGRRDLVCRPCNGWQLHQALSASRMVWVDDGGHNPFQAGNSAAMVAALDDFALGKWLTPLRPARN